MGRDSSGNDQHIIPPAISIPHISSYEFLHHTTLRPRPKLILIGDSITEQGSTHAHGWVTSLSIRYNRRIDVMNRGMNGYNTRLGMACLPLILEEILGPSSWTATDGYEGVSNSQGNEHLQRSSDEDDRGEGKEQCSNLSQDQQSTKEITSKSMREQLDQHYPQYAFLIGFGANDSSLVSGSHSRYHVPLEEYSLNLKRMIHMIQTWHSSDTHVKSPETTVSVALISPPPCDTLVLQKSRDNELITKLYAQECAHVASQMNIPFVDLWNGMQLPVENDTRLNDEMNYFGDFWKKEYLSDGLHLTPLGNYNVYQLVVQMLERSFTPSCVQKPPNPDKTINVDALLGLGFTITNLPRQYPDHSVVDIEHLGQSFNATA